MLQIGAEACVFALDATGDYLAVACATPALDDLLSGLQIPVGSGVSGWVAAHRSSIRKADAVLDIGHAAGQIKSNVCTSVPIFVCGDLFGVLTVYMPAIEDVDAQTASVGRLALEVGLLITAGLEVAAPRRRHAESPFAAVS